jgi:MATE family multidrug resistance protein
MARRPDEEEQGDELQPLIDGPRQRSTKEIAKEVTSQIIPYSLNGLMINGSFFLNTWVLSQLGSDTLAASSLASSAQLLTIATSKGILVSTSNVAGRNVDRPEMMGVVLQQSCLLAGMISVPVIGIFLGSEWIFILLGQNKNISSIAGNYLTAYAIATPAVLLLKSLEMFAIAAKKSNLVLAVNLLNTATTFGLTYGLALGKGPFPKLGVEGSAFAAAISTWAASGGLLLYFKCNKEFKPYKIFTLTPAARKEMLKLLLRVGFPIGIQIGVEFLYNFIKSILAGNLSADSLSAEQIVTQYSSLVLSPVLATATIGGALISRDITENNALNVKTIGWVTITSALIVPTISLALFPLAAKPMTSVFLDESDESYDDIVELAQWLFIINAVNNFVDGIRQGATGSLRGFYDTAIPAFLILTLLWVVSVPTSYVLGFPAGLGVWGLFMGRGASLLASTPLILRRWMQSSNDPEAATTAAEQPFKKQLTDLFRCAQTQNNADLSEEEEEENDDDSENNDTLGAN